MSPIRTRVKYRTTINSRAKNGSVTSSTVETSTGAQIAPLQVQGLGASGVTTESIRAVRRHPDLAD